jgi:hypothetical protein
MELLVNNTLISIKKDAPNRSSGRVSTGGPMKYRGCTSQYIYKDAAIVSLIVSIFNKMTLFLSFLRQTHNLLE